jgi:molybdate transport system ATP-binding protein
MIEINVKKKFPGLSIEAGLNIEDKMFATLFGNSGAGKTTLLRMLAGIEMPDEGYIRSGNEIWYDSKKKINLSPQLRKTGYVFQDYALFPNMTVLENLVYALPGALYKNREKIAAKKEQSFIREILEITGLNTVQNFCPNALSGGQKQRVALARAIARRPSVLLLDEPFSSLDHELRYRLQEELAKIVKNFSLTVLMVTHDYSDIFKMADEVFIMNSGKLTENGKPSEIFLSKKISNKFIFEAQILDIAYDEVLYILTLLIGPNVVKIVATEEESNGLLVGDRIVVASKSFHPVVVGKINAPPDSKI